jgi:hypothetical protein
VGGEAFSVDASLIKADVDKKKRQEMASLSAEDDILGLPK